MSDSTIQDSIETQATGTMSSATPKFWETKKLAEMTTAEWESLCDSCGKCCLHKLEDEETGDIAFTSVVCDLIDLDTCQHAFAEYNWLPDTCAYRLLTDGKPLPAWHPLLTGDPGSVKAAGIAISSYAIKEAEVEDMEDHIIGWLCKSAD